MGDAYWELENDEKALICFRHARAIGRKNAEKFLEAQALWKMSLIYQKSGPADEAMHLADLASQACPEGSTEEETIKLSDEIKDYMVKKVEEDIKESGL